MAKCPFCRKILPDEWLKREGASVLGRAGGKSKARSTARDAALARWNQQKKAQAIITPLVPRKKKNDKKLD